MPSACQNCSKLRPQYSSLKGNPVLSKLLHYYG
jgi:hypothetical protein